MLAGRWLGLTVMCVLLPALAQDRDKRIVSPGPTGTARRVALVIGNQDYPSNPLSNPRNDAVDVARALGEVGFTVTPLFDANREQLSIAIDKFGRSLKAGDIVVFYYSGHGIAVQGQNYLIPIDFQADEEELVKFRAYAADEVLTRIEVRKPRLTMVILDACRNNPFLRSKGDDNGGLVKMREPKGSLIAFAAGPGQKARDLGNDRNSLFTKFFLQEMKQPGLQVSELFDRVVERVDEASGGKIMPSIERSMVGRFAFRDAIAVDPKRAEAQKYWVRIRDRKDPALFEDFIREYPDDDHVAEARDKVRRLNDELAAAQQKQQAEIKRQRDETSWKFAARNNTRSAFENYLEEFPQGLHAAEARATRDRLAKLEEKARLDREAKDRQQQGNGALQQDEVAWRIARTADTKAGYEDYLANFTSHAGEARQARDRLADLETKARLDREAKDREQQAAAIRQEDEGAWQLARMADTKTGYQGYLAKYTLHVAEARDLMSHVVDKVVPPDPNLRVPYSNPKDKSDFVWIPGGAFHAVCSP
jgi:uncharacterized caspase-like protein